MRTIQPSRTIIQRSNYFTLNDGVKTAVRHLLRSNSRQYIRDGQVVITGGGHILATHSSTCSTRTPPRQ